MGMNADEWTSVDERGWMDGTGRTDVDGCQMEVDGCLTELQRMSNGIATNIGWNHDERHTE